MIMGFSPCVSLNYVITSAKEQDAIVYETTPVENFELYPNRGMNHSGK